MDHCIVKYIVIFILGYIIGSIPDGLIIGKKFYNIDLREHGSKNIGATNTFRTLGPKAAAIVFATDAIKGIVGVAIALFILPGVPLAELIGGVAAIAGHNWSLFLRFNGGKGVATGLGVIIMLSWQATLLCLVVWAIIVWLTRYVSLASMLGAVCAPIFMWYFGKSPEFIVFAMLVAVFIIVRHRSNIGRLIKGTELKIKPGNARQVDK